jgi:hypothetical protein
MLARAEDIGKIVHELGTCDVRHAAGYEAILRRVSRSEGSSIPITFGRSPQRLGARLWKEPLSGRVFACALFC